MLIFKGYYKEIVCVTLLQDVIQVVTIIVFHLVLKV